MSKSNLFYIIAMVMALSITIPLASAYAEDDQTLDIEVRYTNGDRISTYQAKYVVYQDNSQIPFLEKDLEINPDTITLPKNHEYRVEIFVNGIFSEMKKIELNFITSVYEI